MLLAADIGGTKTLMQISNAEGEVFCQQRFVSNAFARFDDLLADFLNSLPGDYFPIHSACLAVAGPVAGRTAKVTIRQITLINDFAAVGEGIACLNDEDLLVLQTGIPDLNAPRAVIGAGTGLGEAFMTPTPYGWHVWATEGGHVDFAPTDSQQQKLLDYLLQQYLHVSYERLVSGMGLVNIYRFLSDSKQLPLRIDTSADMPAQISELARRDDPLANHGVIYRYLWCTSR